jgi:hypothetical protein
VDAFTIFGIQNFFSFVVFGLLAWWYVWPWLRSVDRTTAFTALTFVHALRSIGATVLVASVAGTALPRDFATAVAYGDLATSVLAVMTLVALRARLSFAIALVWLTNVVGTVDLLNALVGGIGANVAALGMGSFWYVVAFLVPILWIAHALAFLLLLRPPLSVASAASTGAGPSRTP